MIISVFVDPGLHFFKNFINFLLIFRPAETTNIFFHRASLDGTTVECFFRQHLQSDSNGVRQTKKTGSVREIQALTRDGHNQTHWLGHRATAWISLAHAKQPPTDLKSRIPVFFEPFLGGQGVSAAVRAC